MSRSAHIQFILNGQLHQVEPVDTHQTLLQYLRGQAALRGTKEGCAEGDCGACTLVVGELSGNKIVYRALNACILLLAQIDGCEVISVEGVQDKDGGLHPVQQALVDFHGSQCGFCTPGFVMSLYAHYRNGRPADRESLKTALAGNLCRCTGYGPILAAGQAMYNYQQPEVMDTVSLLREIANNELVLHVADDDNQLFAPTNESELQQLLQQYPTATLWAGGTDAGLWITKRLARLPTIIMLGKIAELNFVRQTSAGIHMGAMARYVDVCDILATEWPAFGEVIRRTGSVQVRNAGTLGGNIANGSPIGDMAPVLIALGAKLTLAKQGSTREILLEDFFVAYGQQDLGPGEYVRSIFIPTGSAQLATWKISKRFDQDISAVLGAFCFSLAGGRITELRIAYGGMAATPKRALATEAVLLGQVPSEEILATATLSLAEDFTPISDMRASSSYRMQSAQALLRKTFSASHVYLAKTGAADA
ncbi:MAG: xanthine dehydrogenase small subunit [Robiginitomaculum sp.]|nr:xanthine dehydrogenase small subunit [Robiginitomaculum sp.]